MKNKLRKRIINSLIVIFVLFAVFLFFYSLILSSINYVNYGMTLETRFWYLIFAFDLLAIALTTIITIIYKVVKSPPSDETKEAAKKPNKYIAFFIYFFAIGALFFLIMHYLVKYFLVALIPSENINTFLDLNPLFSVFVRFGQVISAIFFILTAIILFMFYREKGQVNNNKSD